MLIGEIGDKRAEKMMQEYTGGEDKLHTAYSFRLLNDEFGAAYFAQVLNQQEALLSDGWPTWAFSNHDITRVISRWGKDFRQRNALTKTLLGFLFCLRGSVCLYQGEELGLPEAELCFEQLQDPWGIAFWPEFKGRDGCRTPMPWDTEQPNAGFSTGSPWLPVAPGHYPLAARQQEEDGDSALQFTRQFLALRKQLPALISGDISEIGADGDLLMFKRNHNTQTLLCWFWLCDNAVQFDTEAMQLLHSSNAIQNTSNLHFNGPGFAIFAVS